MMGSTLDDLEREQERLQLTGFDYAAAWALGLSLQGEAAARALPVAIEISHGSTVVFTALLPGATPDNLDWTRRKRSVALRFHRSSLYMRLQSEHHGWSFHDRFRLPEADFAASGGALPIMVRGVGVVGTAAMSGLPDVEDHAIVAGAIAELMQSTPEES